MMLPSRHCGGDPQADEVRVVQPKGHSEEGYIYLPTYLLEMMQQLPDADQQHEIAAA
jgi:hypothetical protein